MELTLTVEDKRYDTFLALLKTLDYVSVDRPKAPLWQEEEVNSRLQQLRNTEMTTRSWSEAKQELFKR